MIKNRDILYWAGPTFGKISIAADLAKMLGKYNRVLYIEYPESFLRMIYHRSFNYWWKSIIRLIYGQRFRNPSHTVTVYILRKIPFLLISYPELVRRLVLRFNIWFIKRYMKKQKFKDVILIVQFPTAYEVLKAFDKSISIYYCVDDYAAQPEYKNYPRRRAHIEELDKKIMKEADICLFSSEDLIQRKQEYCLSGHLLKVGVDMERYTVSSVSSLTYLDNAVNKPIIGFIGLINERIDWNILTFSSEKLADDSFVFIGIERRINPHLKKISNFYFLGEMEPEDLGQFVVTFDVGIIPYVVDSTTTFINPVKIYEYLAAGLAVISTPLPDIVKMAEELGHGYIYIADSPEAFSDSIIRALREDSPDSREKRKMAAAECSWEKRAEEFTKIIESYEKK